MSKFVLLARQIGGTLHAIELNAAGAGTARKIADIIIRRDFNKPETALEAADVLEISDTLTLDVPGIYRRLAHDLGAEVINEAAQRMLAEVDRGELKQKLAATVCAIDEALAAARPVEMAEMVASMDAGQS